MPAPKIPFVWSALTVKSIDESERVLEGVASTPSTDRVGDIVESMGATYRLPIPFLFQHDSSQPIGHVIRAAPNASGIPVTIQLVKSTEPGTLKDRLDEAWQSIKLGLVKGLSIGFKPVETSYIEATGGYRFSKWDWLELSAVTIPANADASISTIKRCDLGLASSVPERSDVVFPKSWSGITPNGFVGKLARKLLPAVGDVIVEALAPMKDRIRVLEVKARHDALSLDDDAKFQSLVDQIARLRAAMAERKYFGVWEPGGYREHNSVTHKGSLWIALRDTQDTPGTTEDWQLAVKKGRDARD